MEKILFVVLALIMIVSAAAVQDNIERKDGGIKTENKDFVLDWDLEVTGYSPHSGKFILEGTALRSKETDRKADIAIISPVPLVSMSSAVVWEDIEEVLTEEKIYPCDGQYGWNNEEHTQIYCARTYTRLNNQTEQIENYTSTSVIDVNSGISVTDLGDSIAWNNTKTVKRISENVISSKISSIEHKTDYGNYVYYVKNNTFKADEDYRFRFEIDVAKEMLPVKYTVCIGDAEANIYYFCLDPTIVDARTWTTDADFTNGTTLLNLTAENDDLRLDIDNDAAYSDSLIHYYSFDSNASDSVGSLDGSVDGATSTTAKNNNGYSFDGTNDRITYDGGSRFYDDSGDFSVSYCVYIDSDGTGVQKHISALQCDSNAGMAYYYTHTGDIYHVQMNNVGDILSDSALTEDAWTHIVFTRNVSGTIQNALYINGVSQTLSASEQTYDPISGGSSYTNVIGAQQSDCFSYVQFTKGDIDEIAFWNRSLTEEEVVSLNNSHFYSPGSSETFSQGLYSDVQGWYPQNGSKLTSVDVQTVLAVDSSILFKYNSTNASLDSSEWINLTTNGTNIISLDLSNDQPIYYQFKLIGPVSTPSVTSYTLQETIYSESGANNFIDLGIQQSSAWPEANVYNGQQVYLRNLNNDQILATVDRVVVYGNKRWIINYALPNESLVGLTFNITPVVYVESQTHKRFIW